MRLLRAKQLTKHIYNAIGVTVTPFELDDIPEDWLEAILALEVEIPRKATIIKHNKVQ